MLTRNEIEEKKLVEGKDFVYIGRVRYQVGDSFYRGNKKIGIKEIIDPVHFLSDDYSCWHTYMFHDFKCRHGKNMIPLEFNSNNYDDAEERLQANQVFTTDIFEFNKNKKIEHKGKCLIRFSPETNNYILEIGENNMYISNALCSVLNEAFGNQYNEMLYVLQDWGVSGENPQEVLLDDNCKTIKYKSIENTAICSARLKTDSSVNVTLMKKHCSPAQTFILVGNIHLETDGAHEGNELWESLGFYDAKEAFVEFTDKTIEQAFKLVSEAEL